MAFDLNQFRNVFFGEVDEQLATIAACLECIEGGQGVHEAAQEAFRCAHSIKGASATFGYGDVSAVAGALAGVFDAAVAGRLELDGHAMDACRAAHERLAGLIAAVRSPQQLDPEQGAGGGVSPEGADADEPDAATDPDDLLGELRTAAGEIREMLARMECLMREHAELAGRTEAAVSRFCRQFEVLARLAGTTGVEGVFAPTVSCQDVRADARTGRRHSVAPLPKVGASSRRGRGLAQEWEDF